MEGVLLSAGALSSLVLEGIKYILRKWVYKDPTYDFDPKFYRFAIPLLNAVMPFVLVLLGLPVTDPILSMTWQGGVRYLVLIALSSLVSILTNETVIRPVKDYADLYKWKYK
jgi:uncharacterized membrane protein (UPF0182 family)